MSYIRTVRTIYKGTQVSDYTLRVVGKNGRTYPVSLKSNYIVDRAETIDKLCDEFIVYDIHKHKYLHFFHLQSLFAYCDENGLDITTIKAAIWTDKGLIYVAKINYERELILL